MQIFATVDDSKLHEVRFWFISKHLVQVRKKVLPFYLEQSYGNMRTKVDFYIFVFY